MSLEYKKWIPTIISVLFATGVEVSGFQSLPLAVSLWTLAVLLSLWPLYDWLENRTFAFLKNLLLLFSAVAIITVAVSFYLVKSSRDNVELKDSYAVLTNKQIKTKTAALVWKLKHFRDVVKKKTDELILEHDSSRKNAQSNEQHGALKDKYDKLFMDLNQKMLNDYESLYRTEALVLRDTIFDRLPGEFKEKWAKKIGVIFFYPTNIVGLDQVISSLEMLTKYLPD